MPHTLQPCTRCSSHTQTYNLRKDHFCASCLQTWILARLTKRVGEGLRITKGGRDSSRRVLLPLSGGISSLSLLHLLDLHAEGRHTKTGRIGYEVIGLWVDQGAILHDDGFEEQTWELVKARYGRRWQIVKIDVQDVLSDQGPLREEDRKALLTNLPFGRSTENMEPLAMLISILKGLPEPSSRTDLLTALRTRLINAFAQKHECSIVIWGDTTTRLAEKTLAEAAKGRGFSLPWQTGDGPTPFHGIKYMYPFQDLYRKEIEVWAEAASDPKISDIIPAKPKASIQIAAASSRNLTIDDLMRQYFSNVEESYPSIVANVVRTSNKLEAPQAATEKNGGGLVSCCICGLSYDAAVGGFGAWEGNQRLDVVDHRHEHNGGAAAMDANGHGLENDTDRQVCYGCSRTIEKARIF